MAEAIGIATGIRSILRDLTGTAAYIDGLQSAAALPVRQVSLQLLALNATLSALAANLGAVDRPQEFVVGWEPVANAVLEYITTTIAEINGRLGGAGGDPGPEGAAWPPDGEYETVLSRQLHGCLRMLALIQNGWMQ